MQRAFDRLLRYVTVYTRSDEASTAIPSTRRQFDLANQLRDEMEAIGLSDVSVSDTCCVYGFLPATPGMEHLSPLGFLAHMDTADFEAEHVRPRVIENYDGGVIALGCGRVLDPEKVDDLKTHIGCTVMVTDGSTLLGGDDKAGIAEILTLCEKLQEEKLPHGKLCICFTPDEEIGRGTDGLDIRKFGAKYAYTVDGSGMGCVEYETFNAAAATVTFHGVSIHPGGSKNTMVNASLAAMEFNAMLPAGDIPRHTTGRQGFFHLTEMRGDVASAELRYIVRDHDAVLFQKRQDMLLHAAELINDKYGPGTAEVTLREQYRNMGEKVLPCMFLVEHAKDALRQLGIEPSTPAVRGGTDGSKLSFMGIPCPNLCTGNYACHGPFEHAYAEDMDTAVEMLCGIVKRFRE